jgi:hypothetical protein
MPQYKPFGIQQAAHKALLIDNYRRALLYWSRRTGKTMWSVEQLIYSCMLSQGPHHIVFKEYQHAETVAWNQYIHLIPKDMIAPNGLNKSTLSVTFRPFQGTVKLPEPIGTVELIHNPNKPPASIRLLGSDKADSHRGGESYGMIFDEYQDQDHYGWDSVYKYFLATTNGWAVFMGTANPEDVWNEMLERAERNYEKYPKGRLEDSEDELGAVNQRWYYDKSTWRNNPLIRPAWVAAERTAAEEEGTLGSFLQETELIPFAVQGAVYPMFNKDIHVIKNLEDIPNEGTEYIALDFGFAEGHPMAACFIRITRDDIWYQWDEIYGTGILIDDLCAEIRVKMGDRQLTGIVADSARPDLIEYMQSKGFPVIPSPKKQNSITSGIALLAKRLRPKIQIMGPPKPNYYVSYLCKGTIYGWTHYRYKEIKESRPVSELPEKRNDDALDAIRYLELFFKFGIQKDDKPIKSSIVSKELNSYGLL